MRGAALARVVVASVLLGGLAPGLSLGVARAEPSSQERALAETLFREAKALARDGAYDAACPKFEESQRIDPQLGTLLHLATCHAEQGKTASAWAEFSAAAELAERQGDTRRAELAAERADALEPTLSRLLIARAPGASPPTLVVRLDGERLGAAVLGTAMPVDPGRHVITASATGFKTLERAVDVAAGGATFTLELGDLTPIPRSAAPPPETAPSETNPVWITGWVVFGVGVASALVGGGMGVAAALERDAADERCEGRFCSAEGLAMHDTARTYATVSTVTFIAGMAAVAAGVVIVVASDRVTGADSAWLEATLQPGGGTLTLGARW